MTTIQTEVARSKFIATIYNADSVETVRNLLSAHRASMPDASHHVYAFRVGFGNSVVEGLSDDGEPNGTSGPPIMSVLRGSGLGDTLIVVTRYFGGTLLGTGGLVRAYTEAASLAVKACPTKYKIEYTGLRLLLEYPAFNILKRILDDYDAEIIRETFTDIIELHITIPTPKAKDFITAITERTAGAIYTEWM